MRLFSRELIDVMSIGCYDKAMNLRDISQRFFSRPRKSPVSAFYQDLVTLGIMPVAFEEIEGKSAIPFQRIRTGLQNMLQSPAHLLGETHVAIYDEERMTQKVILSDITGCLNSKELDSRFAHMAEYHDMPHYISQWKERADELAEQLLSQDTRGVTEAGKPVHILRQSWDGQMWLSNIDGSHRATTLWAIDQAAGYRRPIPDSDVVTLRPSNELLDYDRTHHVWVFAAQADYNFRHYPEARAAGVHLHKLFGEEGQHNRYALSLPRGMADAASFDTLLKNTCSLTSVIEERLSPATMPSTSLTLKR